MTAPRPQKVDSTPRLIGMVFFNDVLDFWGWPERRMYPTQPLDKSGSIPWQMDAKRQSAAGSYVVSRGTRPAVRVGLIFVPQR